MSGLAPRSELFSLFERSTNVWLHHTEQRNFLQLVRDVCSSTEDCVKITAQNLSEMEKEIALKWIERYERRFFFKKVYHSECATIAQARPYLEALAMLRIEVISEFLRALDIEPTRVNRLMRELINYELHVTQQTIYLNYSIMTNRFSRYPSFRDLVRSDDNMENVEFFSKRLVFKEEYELKD